MRSQVRGTTDNELVSAIPFLLIVILLILGAAPAYSFATDQDATLVIGQTGFTSSGHATTTADGLYSPVSVALDSSGNLWVADYDYNRVLEYLKGGGFSTGQSASLVIGQSDFTSGGAATTATGLDATGLNGPSSVAFDASGNLWVADEGNNRVLEYLKGSGFSTGQSASLVIGQTDFTSGGAATTAGGLSSPVSVALDSSGNLWVADSRNARVLGFADSLQGTTTTTSTSSAPSGGIPEFPLQLGIGAAFTILVMASYLLVRRRSPFWQ